MGAKPRCLLSSYPCTSVSLRHPLGAVTVKIGDQAGAWQMDRAV